MLNHVRTLLLNQDGNQASGPDYPYEELVDPNYRAVSLPTALSAVHAVLFGGSPDRAYLNVRLQQYLSLLHAGGLEEFILDKDPRVTYLTWRDDATAASRFGARVVQTAGSATPFAVVGEPEADDALGRLFTQWRVEVTDAALVTVRRQTPPVETTVQGYTLTDGLSDLLPLAGADLFFRFGGGVGNVWEVEALARPGRDLAAVLNRLENVVNTVSDALFGPAGREPYQTFANLWRADDRLPYRLGGVLLALAYRIDELRS